MALYKRGNLWYTRFTAPNGQRVRETTRTADKRAAQEYEDRLKAELWRQSQLKEKPRRTWQEAAVKWLRETRHKRTHEKDIAKLRWMDPFLRDKYLDEIDRDLIEAIAEAKSVNNQQKGDNQECSPITVNRYLALIKAILRTAWQEWDWIDKAPKIRMHKETGKRVRFLSREEAERLFSELPQHLAELARFAVHTGLRRGNIVNLKWQNVDLRQKLAWVDAGESKSGYPIGVPLNREACVILQRQIDKHPTNVFTYNGKPVLQVCTKAWHKACKRAGIEDFRFHDLRHTWASWHAQNGTPLSVLQELGGWRSPAMVQRYAHLTAGHLVHYAENIASDTNLAQPSLKVVR